MKHMDDTAEHRFPRLAPILLVGVLIGFAMVRPGYLFGAGNLAYRFTTTFVAITAVAYVAWRFHGILPAAAAITLFWLAQLDVVEYAAMIERGEDAVFLAALVLGLGAASRQGRSGPTAWVLLALIATAVAYFGAFGGDLPGSIDPSHDRIRHVIVGYLLLAVGIGFLARDGGWQDRVKMFAVTVLIPAAGVGVTRLVTGQWPRFFESADWSTVAAEWRDAFANGSWSKGAWAWTLPWVVAPLMMIGLWRTLARGRKEWKKGRAPLPWLPAAAGIGGFIALGARPTASESLALAAIGSLLSVFGIADLIQALVERIALAPPEPGPSDIPRVR
jgi:hypothetical protein